MTYTNCVHEFNSGFTCVKCGWNKNSKGSVRE